jgi:hypothetical protein
MAAALALVAPRAMGQCTLRSAVDFGAGNAPGASPSTFRAGYENDVELYTTSTGARRLLLMFDFGYGVMGLANPGFPTAVVYKDMRSDIPANGDGQNYVTSMGVAPDGARAVFSLGDPAVPFHAAVGTASGSAFFLKGDFSAGKASGGTVVQKTSNGRYIAYALLSKLKAADITSLPGGPLTAGSIQSELSAFPSGLAGTLQLAGNYLSYLSSGVVRILDASNPGSSPPNITAGFTQTTLSVADFQRSSGSPISLATAVDPAAPSALYVLVEFSGSTPGYSLMRVQGSTKTLIGRFDVPTVAGETWVAAYSSALVTAGSEVYVLMWANRTAPSTLYRLYSTSVEGFGATSGAIDFNPVAYSSFKPGNPMRGFGSSDGTVNAYIGTGMTAYAFTLACTSPNSPATADMTVASGATQLADGATVFLGDTVTISPIVNPPPSFRPLSDWRFDFDFHQGVASEDNGSSPRLKAPDLSYPGSGTTPPAAITLVGPCDPRSGGTPSTGAGCWASETSNGDFAANAPAGTTASLHYALEATNVNGSAPAKIFTLKWKVPAVRLLSAQVLLGMPLASGSDGHPSPSGFKWYFGSSPSSLTLKSCVTSSCLPTQAKGTYYYWLTVPYPNGYTSPDCGSPCTRNLGSFTVSDVSLALTNVPTSVYAGRQIGIQDASTYATGVTACPSGGSGFEYNLCDATTGSCQAGAWQTLALARGGSVSVTAPSTPGTYWLRVRYNYTTGVCPSALYASWPGNAQTDPGYAITVAPVPPTIFVRVNGQDPCPAGPGGSGCSATSFPANAGDTITVWADLNGVHDGSPPAGTNWDLGAGASPASCAGTGCQGFAFTYTVGGTATITLTGYATTANMVALIAVANVTASNNGPVCAGTPLTLTSTGPASAAYAWTGPNGFTAAVQNPTIATPTTAASGVYQVTRTYSGTATAQTTATVKPSPIVPTAGNNGPLCTGQALALTAATVSGATYGWTGPNGFTSSLQNPTLSNVTTAASGTYIATATVNGCSTAASTGVTVKTPPPAPVAANGGPICAGGTLVLTASTIASATYAWTGPNGFTSALQNPSIPNATAAAAGVYSVTATVNGCAGPTASTTAVVNAVSAAIAAPTRICLTSGNTGTASVPDAGGGATYAWTITNGAITGGQGTPSIAFSVAGVGTTTLGITVDSGVCSANGSATIAVQSQCGGLSTLTPCRAVDTRNATSPLGGPSLQPNGVRLFNLVSVCGVPPTAKAVSANLTVVGPTASGALHVYPGDLGTAPSATAISFSPGKARANNAIIRLATDGTGTVAVLCESNGVLDLIIDVNGYFE